MISQSVFITTAGLAFCIGAVLGSATNIAPAAFVGAIALSWLLIVLLAFVVVRVNRDQEGRCYNCGRSVPEDAIMCGFCERDLP